MTECPVCGANVEVPAGTEESELITCKDCGTDLEVKSTDPVKLEEAPQEEEDWGQ